MSENLNGFLAVAQLRPLLKKLIKDIAVMCSFLDGYPNMWVSK